MKACIIGAGSSGIVCVNAFKKRGVEFDCFEKGSGIGGLWRFQNDNGTSSAYRSLHINTSKRMMEFSDYPFPDYMAEYPSHAEILQYFEQYCELNDLYPHITFNTEVISAQRKEEGGWKVHIKSGDGQEEHKEYDHVVVATGHHWDPRTIDLPGDFSGETFHAHHYIDINNPVETDDKTVVVMGSGNSAMDISCELGQAFREGRGPKKVYLSQRSGVWIVPKVMGNTAQDVSMRHPMKRPGKVEQFLRDHVKPSLLYKALNRVSQTWIRFVVGDPERFGLKQPKEMFGMRHPTVSQDIHARLVHGDITPIGDIKKVEGKKVTFEDGTEVEADVIVQCTGYNITFPFLDNTLIEAKDNDISLFQRIFVPRYPDLSFLGLVQTLCAIMPISELQAHFIADYLNGNYKLPSQDQMQEEANKHHNDMKNRFTHSKSHTIQIDCNEYSHFLYKEWDEGKAR